MDMVNSCLLYFNNIYFHFIDNSAFRIFAKTNLTGSPLHIIM
jgi:hypothetical protein